MATEIHDARGAPVLPRILVDGSGNDLTTLEAPTAVTPLPARTTNAGTAAKVIVAATPCKAVNIVAKPANTGMVYIGDATVSASLYYEILNPGDSVNIEIADASAIYFDVSVNGEGIQAGILK